jgi:hypothetical protein
MPSRTASGSLATLVMLTIGRLVLRLPLKVFDAVAESLGGFEGEAYERVRLLKTLIDAGAIFRVADVYMRQKAFCY